MKEQSEEREKEREDSLASVAEPVVPIVPVVSISAIGYLVNSILTETGENPSIFPLLIFLCYIYKPIPSLING